MRKISILNRFIITFMTTKKLNSMDKMSMKGGGPSHSRSSHTSFHTTSSASFEIAAMDVRLVVVEVIELS